MIASLVPLALALVAISKAAPTSRCTQLWELGPAHLPNLTVYVAQDYALGTNFTDPTALPGGYDQPVPNLPAFCRFGAYFNTSSTSRVQFEVWLPTGTWNGRMAMVGNGGDAGGINYPDMGSALRSYDFASVSTDTGHNGTSGSFAINPETAIDFGYRAVHLTSVYSKEIIKQFYQDDISYSYWLGCSSGGKQGLKEVQMYPEDFDGVLAVAAAQWWTHLNGWTYHANAHINTPGSIGFLNATDYALIAQTAMAQCDELDGVKDEVITNYNECKPNLTALICPGGTKAPGCLLAEQVETINRLWSPWISTEGEWLFPGFNVGFEGSPINSVTGDPFTPDFFNYQVLNNTVIAPLPAINVTELEKLLKIADATDPGMTNAVDGNIAPFLARGKLITAVGDADGVIPSNSSVWYYEHVRETLGYPDDLGDAYRFFEIPGYGHCFGDQSAWNAGLPGVRDDSQGGFGQAPIFDRHHDMTLALIAWTEEGITPDMVIGTRYINNTRALGIQYQRPICPYPQKVTYIGGDQNSADSFECK